MQEQRLEKIHILAKQCEQTALYAYTKGDPVCPEFAQVIYLCPTNLCNHRCITCAYPLMRKGLDSQGCKQQGIMDWKLFVDIVEQLPEVGRRIYLQKTGEPLLHPRIIDMMAHIRKERPAYEIALHTNCARMHAGHIDGLLNYADFIALSVFAFERQQYALAHGKDDYDKVMANLDALHTAYSKSARKPKVYFDVVRCRANAQLTDEEIFALLTERFPLFNVGIHFPYNFQNVIQETHMEIEGIMATGSYPSCAMPYLLLVILWDGKVAYCIADPFEHITMGAVTKNSLQSIWNNENFQKLRLAHSSGELQTLKEKHIHCGECNWLFALKSQSTENLCLVNKKIHDYPLSEFTNGIPITTLENIEAGLLFYRYGDVANALKHFTIAKITASSDPLASLAYKWLQNCEDILRMRKNINSWEDAMNNQGKSLNSIHVSNYHITNQESQKNHVAIKTKTGNKVIKKTSL